MLDFMSHFGAGPNETQAIDHIVYELNSNHDNDHLLKNVSDETLRMITKKQLYKLGGPKQMGSYPLWITYTSKDLLECVRQELSIIQELS